jgi:hypothetical protein
LSSAAFLASSGIVEASTVSACAAVRSDVCRMVLAWKKFQVSDALMLSEMPSVCALLPNISAIASSSAITEMSSAIFLLVLSNSGLRPPPPPGPCSSCSIWCWTSCCTACTP